MLAHAWLTRCASAFRVSGAPAGAVRPIRQQTVMPNTTTALTAAGETYFADLGRVRASGECERNLVGN